MTCFSLHLQTYSDAERMRELLVKIDQEKGAGADHRRNGISTKNAGAQMGRAQRQVQHNTLFGELMMVNFTRGCCACVSDQILRVKNRN